MEWTYLRLDQIQDGGWPPSWKISNGYISGMSYPIHFHELQSSVGGIQEKMHEEELDWSQSKIFLVIIIIIIKIVHKVQHNTEKLKTHKIT